MKNNQKFMPLNIQLFAEDEKGDNSMESTAERVEKGQDKSEEKKDVKADKENKEEKAEKTFTRDEVNKMIHAEKNKIRNELEKEAESKRKEAEKLAKMDADQKIAYELEKSKQEVENYKKEINTLNMKNEANSYATQKGVPIGYIEDWDFSNMTSDDVKVKIDKLATVRSNDLKGYLNKNLRQSNPQERGEKEIDDPYLKGFKNYMKKNK